MRNLHDQLTSAGLDASGDQVPGKKNRPRLRSSFVNTVDYIEAPFYATIGFIEGAFTPHSVNETNKPEETTIERNVTQCRLNTIRFINNITYLAWYSELDYGIDRIMLFGT